jgi:hypothetical protein
MDRDRFRNAFAESDFKVARSQMQNEYSPQHQEKLANALKHLGTHYVLHPDNRVRKIDAPRKRRHS